MWQGAHMSMLRDLTDALVLSGYHGPAVQDVVSQVDWKNAVQMDIRPLIGRYLHGDPVLYPSTNPGPPLSKIRENLSGLVPFLKTLSSCPSTNGLFPAGRRSPRVSGCGGGKVRLAANPCAALLSEKNPHS